MSKFYKFIIFSLYEKNLKSSGAYNPKVMTAVNISSLQLLFFFLIVFLLSFFSIIDLSNLRLILYIIPVIVYICNHYFITKTDYLERIKIQFEGSRIDTKTNKQLVMVLALVYIATVIFLIIFFSYLKSK